MDRSEFQPQEVSERGEAVESTESRALEEATFEPAACVEGMGDYQQAEAIQTSLESAMASLTTAKVPVGEVSTLPVPLPRPEDEIGAKGTVKGTEGTLEMILPGTAGEQVGIDPIPVPRPEEEVSATPIPLPQPGEEVSGLPIPIPHTEDEIGAKGTVKGTEGIAEMPLPGTAGEQVGFDPIPLPHEADLASSVGGVAGSGAEGVGITPINLPREADLASSVGGVAGSGAEGVGITPINLPREANVVSDAIEGVMGGSEVAAGGLKGPGGDGVASGAVKGPGGDGVASGEIIGPGGDGVASAPVSQPVPNVAEGGVEGLGSIPAEEIGMKWMPKEPGGVAEMPLPGTTGEDVEPAGESGVIDQIVVNTQEAMEEMSRSFNQQYLILQNKISHENRQFSMKSNIMKNKHDTAKNSINNIR